MFFQPFDVFYPRAAHGENKILLRGLISGCSAGCGHDGPPLFNGMTLMDTDIMDDDYKTITQVRWTREPPAGVANLSMRGERRCAAQGGAIWCAAAAIIVPFILDG